MRTLTAGVLVLLLIPAVAGASVSTAKVVGTPSGLISCHAVVRLGGGGISCSARYLEPPPGTTEGDPFLALHRHGKAVLGSRGDYDGYVAKLHTLAYGDTWKRPGIRCSLATSGLTCHNLDGHGFHLAKGAVRLF